MLEYSFTYRNSEKLPPCCTFLQNFTLFTCSDCLLDITGWLSPSPESSPFQSKVCFTGSVLLLHCAFLDPKQKVQSYSPWLCASRTYCETISVRCERMVSTFISVNLVFLIQSFKAPHCPLLVVSAHQMWRRPVEMMTTVIRDGCPPKKDSSWHLISGDVFVLAKPITCTWLHYAAALLRLPFCMFWICQ